MCECSWQGIAVTPIATHLAALALIAFSAVTSTAETQAADEPISVEEWRRLTDGRVVWYSLNGEHWGREYFHRGRQSATFVGYDGTCMTAPWVEAEGVFCFAYMGMDCFRHIRRDGQMMVVPLGGGQTQVIEKITDDGPLSCEPPVVG